MGNKCKVKQMLLNEVKLEKEEDFREEEQGKEEEKQGEAKGGPHISIHEFTGIAGPIMMKTQDHIRQD